MTLYRPRLRQLGTRELPLPLRGTCPEDRPTRCTRSGPRRGSRPGSRRFRAARWSGRWRGAGQRPSARAPTRTSVWGGRAKEVPRGPPSLRSGGARRRSRGAGDSRSAAGLSAPEAQARVRGTDRRRPGRALCRPRLSTCPGGHLGGTPLPSPPEGRLLSRRLARLPTGGPLGLGPQARPPPLLRLPPRPVTLGTSRGPGYRTRGEPWTELSSASWGPSTARTGWAIPRATAGQRR